MKGNRSISSEKSCARFLFYQLKLNILENFEIVTVDGVLKKIRSKQKKRSEQLDLMMYLVDFDPAVI